VLDDPAAYISGDGQDSRIVLPEFLLILSNVGTAVVLYPIVRRQNEYLAIGYVAARIIECVVTLLVIPEFIWKAFLGNYCAIWGFRRDSPILSPQAR
jgi:Domain of unknown function (DUF4386)